MKCARILENEEERLIALLAYDVMDTDPEQAYDDLTRIASEICGTPIALVSLVDDERQWFKSKVGLDAEETSREIAFCPHAILEPTQVFVVPDALEDERFADNPLVTGEPHIRFYAGAPLVNSDGLAMGTLCVIDHQPRQLEETQLATLEALARQVVGQLELRKKNLELRRAVTSLKSANEDLQDFTAFAAHDLRSPLNRILAYSSFLKDQEDGKLSPESAADLQRISDSAKGMETLLSSMLDLCGARQGELNDSSVALTDCANLAIEGLQDRIKEKKALICLDELPCVRGDMTLLTQVFHNLIENALKFHGDEAPRIDLTCIYEGNNPSVMVGDNGIGMEKSQAERIFRPFKRAHDNERIDGSGIGLAVVRKIVERHGGEIHVDSAPGEGAQFMFTLAGMRMPRRPPCRESLMESNVSFEGI